MAASASDPNCDEIVESAKGLYRAGRFAEACDLLRDALARVEREYGDEAPELLDVLKWLAMSISARDDSHEALVEELKLQERALNIVKASFGDDDKRTASAHYDVGIALRCLDRLDDALTHFERALSLVTALYEKGHYSITDARRSLGTLLTQMGRPEAAIPLLQEEIEIADNRGHAGSRVVAHGFLGEAFLKAERWEEARKSLETALRCAEGSPMAGGGLVEHFAQGLELARHELAKPS